MATESKRGAGARLAGVLETSTRPEPVDGEPIAEPAQESRGVAPKRSKPVRKAKPRTMYIHDDLWERIIVQSHRKGMTYSDYVADRLERVVPDHRVARTEAQANDAA